MARRVLMTCFVLYGTASIPIVPYAVSRVFVAGLSELASADLPQGHTTIVVLGSGSPWYRGRDGTTLAFLDLAGASRVLEATRVFRSSTDATVISSGGAVGPEPGAPTTGRAMRDALVQLGVPASRITVEERSQSTRDEAVLVAAILGEVKPQTVVLVTSDYHMRRALGAFRSAGVNAVPAIAYDPLKGRAWVQRLLPSMQALALSGSVFREFLASALYGARGWT